MVQDLGTDDDGPFGTMFLAAVAADTVVKIKNGDVFLFDLFHLQRLRRTDLSTAPAADTVFCDQKGTGSGKVAQLFFEKRRQHHAPGIEKPRRIRQFEGGDLGDLTVIFISKGKLAAGGPLQQYEFGFRDTQQGGNRSIQSQSIC